MSDPEELVEPLAYGLHPQDGYQLQSYPCDQTHNLPSLSEDVCAAHRCRVSDNIE
jgi:hypothetical protein